MHLKNKISANKKKVVTIVLVFLFILAVIMLFNSSFAKVRFTESIPLASGKINYSIADLEIVAIYLDGVEADEIPTSGYTFNEESSYCTVGGVEDTEIPITYTDGKIYIGVNRKNTKCYLYFNKIIDTTGPTLTVTTPASSSSSSPTTTSSSSYTVKGTVTDESGVASLTVNGTTVTVGDDGSWSTKVSLTLNSTKTVTVVATDSSGNSTTITRYVKRVDTSGPNLTITDDFDTQSGSNTMAGTVSDTSGVGSVKVNVYLSDGWSSAGLNATHTATISGTSWSVTFDLNTSYYVMVEVVATDSLGNTTTVEAYEYCNAYCDW